MPDFNQNIAPFSWVAHDSSVSVVMSDVGEFKQHIFDSRADDGFEGGGYDWQSLADVFITEQLPHLADDVRFDSESSMFCAYSKNADALKEFIIAFRAALDDDTLILDIFSRAELN